MDHQHTLNPVFKPKSGHIKKAGPFNGRDGLPYGKTRHNAERAEEKMSSLSLMGEHLGRVFMIKSPALYKAAQRKIIQALNGLKGKK